MNEQGNNLDIGKRCKMKMRTITSRNGAIAFLLMLCVVFGIAVNLSIYDDNTSPGAHNTFQDVTVQENAAPYTTAQLYDQVYGILIAGSSYGRHQVSSEARYIGSCDYAYGALITQLVPSANLRYFCPKDMSSLSGKSPTEITSYTDIENGFEYLGSAGGDDLVIIMISGHADSTSDKYIQVDMDGTGAIEMDGGIPVDADVLSPQDIDDLLQAHLDFKRVILVVDADNAGVYAAYSYTRSSDVMIIASAADGNSIDYVEAGGVGDSFCTFSYLFFEIDLKVGATYQASFEDTTVLTQAPVTNMPMGLCTIIYMSNLQGDFDETAGTFSFIDSIHLGFGQASTTTTLYVYNDQASSQQIAISNLYNEVTTDLEQKLAIDLGGGAYNPTNVPVGSPVEVQLGSPVPVGAWMVVTLVGDGWHRVDGSGPPSGVYSSSIIVKRGGVNIGLFNMNVHYQILYRAAVIIGTTILGAGHDPNTVLRVYNDYGLSRTLEIEGLYNLDYGANWFEYLRVDDAGTKYPASGSTYPTTVTIGPVAGGSISLITIEGGGLHTEVGTGPSSGYNVRAMTVKLGGTPVGVENMEIHYGNVYTPIANVVLDNIGHGQPTTSTTMRVYNCASTTRALSVSGPWMLSTGGGAAYLRLDGQPSTAGTPSTVPIGSVAPYTYVDIAVTGGGTEFFTTAGTDSTVSSTTTLQVYWDGVIDAMPTSSDTITVFWLKEYLQSTATIGTTELGSGYASETTLTIYNDNPTAATVTISGMIDEYEHFPGVSHKYFYLHVVYGGVTYTVGTATLTVNAKQTILVTVKGGGSGTATQEGEDYYGYRYPSLSVKMNGQELGPFSMTVRITVDAPEPQPSVFSDVSSVLALVTVFSIIVVRKKKSKNMT